MARKKLENLSFEESLKELEQIVQNLEAGELSLEEAMNFFERGLNLSQLSQEKLQDAEQKIQLLVTQSGKQSLTDFNVDENEQ